MPTEERKLAREAREFRQSLLSLSREKAKWAFRVLQRVASERSERAGGVRGGRSPPCSARRGTTYAAEWAFRLTCQRCLTSSLRSPSALRALVEEMHFRNGHFGRGNREIDSGIGIPVDISEMLDELAPLAERASRAR